MFDYLAAGSKAEETDPFCESVGGFRGMLCCCLRFFLCVLGINTPFWKKRRFIRATVVRRVSLSQ